MTEPVRPVIVVELRDGGVLSVTELDQKTWAAMQKLHAAIEGLL